MAHPRRRPLNHLRPASDVEALLRTFPISPSSDPEYIVRIFPIALIVIGSLGVARYLGLIPVGMFPLVGPILLIALGVALLFRRPRRCRRDGRARRLAAD